MGIFLPEVELVVRHEGVGNLTRSSARATGALTTDPSLQPLGFLFKRLLFILRI